MRTKSRGSSQPRLHPVTSTDGDNRNTGGAFFCPVSFTPFFVCLFVTVFIYLGHVCVEERGQLVGVSSLLPLVVSLGLLPSYLQEKPAPEFAP